MDNEGNNKKILQNSMYDQECSMVFTDFGPLGLVGPRVAMSVCLCVCDIASPVTCHLSHVMCHMIYFIKKNFFIKKI